MSSAEAGKAWIEQQLGVVFGTYKPQTMSGAVGWSTPWTPDCNSWSFAIRGWGGVYFARRLPPKVTPQRCSGARFIQPGSLIGCPECDWTSSDFERGDDFCTRAHTAWIIHYMDQHAPEPIQVSAV